MAGGLLSKNPLWCPSQFTFTDVTGAATSTVTTSSPITVSGLPTGTQTTTTSSGGATFDINNSGNFVSSGLVSNGDTVRARVTSSASASTAVSGTINIGNVVDAFVVTTAAGGSAWADVFVNHSSAGPEFATDGQIVGIRGTTLAHYGERITAGNGASNTLLVGGSWDGVENAVKMLPPTVPIGGPGTNAEYAGIFHGTNLNNSGTKAVYQANFGVCLYFGARAYDLMGPGPKFTGFQMSPTVGGSADNRSALFSGDWPTAAAYIFGLTAATVQAYDNPPTAYNPDSAVTANMLCHVKTTALQNHSASPPIIGQEWIYLEQMIAPQQNGTNPNGRAEVRIWTRDGVVSGRSLVIPLNWDGGWSFANNQYVAFFEYLNGYWNQECVAAHADNYIMASHGRFVVNPALNSFMGPPPGFLL